MPIYEYRCEQGHTFEVLQRMSEDPIVSCQTCDAPVERVFHPVAVHFKGSGFYATDYGSRKRSRELKEAAEGGEKKEGGAKKEDGAKKSESSSSSSSPSSSESSQAKSASASSKSDSSD